MAATADKWKTEAERSSGVGSATLGQLSIRACSNCVPGERIDASSGEREPSIDRSQTTAEGRMRAAGNMCRNVLSACYSNSGRYNNRSHSVLVTQAAAAQRCNSNSNSNTLVLNQSVRHNSPLQTRLSWAAVERSLYIPRSQHSSRPPLLCSHLFRHWPLTHSLTAHQPPLDSPWGSVCTLSFWLASCSPTPSPSSTKDSSNNVSHTHTATQNAQPSRPAYHALRQQWYQQQQWIARAAVKPARGRHAMRAAASDAEARAD